MPLADLHLLVQIGFSVKLSPVCHKEEKSRRFSLDSSDLKLYILPLHFVGGNLRQREINGSENFEQLEFSRNPSNYSSIGNTLTLVLTLLVPLIMNTFSESIGRCL